MKRSTDTGTTLGIAALLAIGALSGCHSSVGKVDAVPVAQRPQPQPYNPTLGHHEASNIDGNPNLTPSQKAAAKASLQQEYGGAVR